MLNQLISYETLKEKVLSNLNGSKPLFISISGIHAYGFSSQEPDIILRGAYIADKESLLGFWCSSCNTVKSIEHIFDNIKLDIACHEINKYIDMIVTGQNGCIIEQIFSPKVIIETNEFLDFKETVKKYFITKRLYNHYNKNACLLYNKLKNSKEKELVDLLYLLRMLHTGIHLFSSGEIITDLKILNQQLYNISFIDELINQKISGKSIIEDNNNLETYFKEIEGLFKSLETACTESSLPENVRNKYKLSRYVANLYYNYVFNTEFNQPVMRHIEDKTFTDREKEKLLLAKKPFAKIEKEIDYSIYPEMNVFMPGLDHYFFVKGLRKKGKFFEFIDAETFLKQLKASNPYAIITLYNSDPDNTNHQLSELKSNQELLITKQLYATCKRVAMHMYNKLKTSATFEYSSKQAIIMLTMLVYADNILKTGRLDADFDTYISVFKAIRDKELPKKQIMHIYEDLLADLESAEKKGILLPEKPDENIIRDTLIQIKKFHWLNGE
jgi:hypothetical protein